MLAIPLAYCSPPPARPRWLVVCLCAEWCGTCREYRPTMASMAAESPEHAFAWVDVEEDAELADDIDIETFPTLLIVEGARVLFFGPLLPGVEPLRRLMRAIDGNGAQPIAIDDETRGLALRLASAAGTQVP